MEKYKDRYDYIRPRGVETTNELIANDRIVFKLGNDAEGDMYYRRNGRLVRLPIGPPGTVIRSDIQGFPEWGGFPNEQDPVWLAEKVNYYTKVQLASSGQSQVHWNNLIGPLSAAINIQQASNEVVFSGGQVRVNTAIASDRDVSAHFQPNVAVIEARHVGVGSTALSIGTGPTWYNVVVSSGSMQTVISAKPDEVLFSQSAGIYKLLNVPQNTSPSLFVLANDLDGRVYKIPQGTITANQSISLSGDVSGTGTTSFLTTIANGAVTWAKIQNLGPNQIFGRSGEALGVGVGAAIPLGAGFNWVGNTLLVQDNSTVQKVQVWLDDVSKGERRRLHFKTTPGGSWNITDDAINQAVNIQFTPSGPSSETDPLFTSHAAYGITPQLITNWNLAVSWGYHALAGYLTSLAHVHYVADNSGVNKFSIGVDQAIRFNGTGGTTVDFDAASKTVTITSAASSGVTAHGDLTGLASDHHTQYLLLSGRGGQTVLDRINVGGGTLASSSPALFVDVAPGHTGHAFAVGQNGNPNYFSIDKTGNIINLGGNAVRIIGAGGGSGAYFPDGISFLQAASAQNGGAVFKGYSFNIPWMFDNSWVTSNNVVGLAVKGSNAATPGDLLQLLKHNNTPAFSINNNGEQTSAALVSSGPQLVGADVNGKEYGTGINPSDLTKIYALYARTADLAFAEANTPVSIPLTTEYEETGITHAANSDEITFPTAGKYNIMAVAQFEGTGVTFKFWIEKWDGGAWVVVGVSETQVRIIDLNNVNGTLNYIVSIGSNEKIRFATSADSLNVTDDILKAFRVSIHKL